MEAMKESMAQMSQMFNDKLAEFEDRQNRITSRKGTPAPSPSECDLKAEFSIFKQFILSALKTLQSQVEVLAKQCDSLEMHTRRKCLILHGVPENMKEDLVAVVVNLVTQNLKLADFKHHDISRCHRMGKSLSSTRPRPILLKVKELAVRAKIWAAKTSLKGTGITISEFLTKARHDVFMAARSRFGVTRCWTRDGTVFVLDANDARHRISSTAELNSLTGPAQGASEDDISAASTKKTPEQSVITSKQSERLAKQKQKLKLGK